jgi:thioester reductase-like protein
VIARPADPRVSQNRAGHLLSPTPHAGVCVESLVDLLRLRATEQPDREAYSFLTSDESAPLHLTHRALDRHARAIGAHLSDITTPGDRVLLLLPTGPEYVAAFIGCLYADLIAVPAYPPSPWRADGQIAAMAVDADPMVVIAAGRTLELLAGSVEQYPTLRGRRWIAIEPLLDADDRGWEPAHTRRSSLAYLQYTSGSTSTPRGVMISHANVLNNLAMIRRGIADRPQTRGVSWAPLFHDLGLVGGMLTPLYNLFPMTMMSPLQFLEDPLRWLRAISAWRATASLAPNFGYDLCVQRSTPAERTALDLSSWNLAVTGAEPIRPATLEQFSAAFAEAGFRRDAFWPAFGLAESTVAVTIGVTPGQQLTRAFDRTALGRGEAIPRGADEADDVSVLATSGRWSHDCEVAIVDPDSGTRQPSGRIGEIWVKSGGVGEGYWNRPADTEATFQARLTGSNDGPFLRTGDLGFVHDDELFVTGRLKDVIVIRGRNHYPQDIEHSAEASHPELRCSCVAAFAVERGGDEQVVVVAEVKRRHWSEPGDLTGIAEAIWTAVAADHQVEPATVALICPGSLAKTSSGKLRRRLIRETWLAGGFEVLYSWERPSELPVLRTDAPALRGEGPTNEVLPALLDCVERALGPGARAFSGDDRVLDLGLDSLRLVQLMLAVEERLGRSLPFARLAANPTLHDLALRLTGDPDGTGQHVDLWSEATLDAEIRPPAGSMPPVGGARKILLTGATGFLGAYLLRELLDRTEAQICCLVRADNEQAARFRLRQNLIDYGLWRDQDAPRIYLVLGDLGRPLLGLGEDRFAALASDVDVVYHNGAWLNFVHPYQGLKSVNVDGTREVLRLACQSRAKPVHYVSTAGVFYGAAYDGRSIGEAEPLDHPDGLELGYLQSKWVAEQLVWEAAQRGLAVSVYRPGWIFGDSRSGRANDEDFFGRLVRGCIQLGKAPRVGYRWHGAPVDDVARAIVTLATGLGPSDRAGRAFHLSGPNAVPWERLVGWIVEAGYPVELVSYDRWLAKLRESDENVLLPLLAFLTERPPGERETRLERYAERDLAHLEGTATRAALPAGVPTCPPLDRDLLHRYLGSYAASGRLPTFRSIDA